MSEHSFHLFGDISQLTLCSITGFSPGALVHYLGYDSTVLDEWIFARALLLLNHKQLENGHGTSGWWAVSRGL